MKEVAYIINQHANGCGVADGELGPGLTDSSHHPEISIEIHDHLVAQPHKLEGEHIILLRGPALLHLTDDRGVADGPLQSI